jgi:excisionase family DNA binding protein
VGASHELPEFLSTSEAAALTGVSPSTIGRWASQGRIQFRVGPRGQRLFRRQDIEAVVIKIEQDRADPDP